VTTGLATEFRAGVDSPAVEPAAGVPKGEQAFRDYAAARPGVREFYRLNHTRQTVDFVRGRREAYLPLRRPPMSVWRAFDALAELVDESDPDLELSQLDHALQTAEALRAAGAPRWLVLTGFVHDLGKVLCLFGEPQWAVVGDTFPVGCAFDPRIVHADLFAGNPDVGHPVYGTPLGLYAEGCGLDKLLLSWGHDEYLYHVLRPYLPAAALAVIRYHSFYAWHREGAYRSLLADEDATKLEAVRRFNPFDLYSKAAARPDWPGLRPYYEGLVAECLPDELRW
jgi:inositol oxygenase